MRFHPVDGFLYMMVGLVNVAHRPLLQALRKLVVLFSRYILMRLVQKLQRSVQPPGPVQVGINRRMIVQILPVIDCSLLDFPDGCVDFMDGVFFFVT